MNNKVGIVQCGSYDPERLYTALKAAAQAADPPDVKGKTVLLKPNILMDAVPEKAITTHPAFCEAIIRLVREWGVSRIFIGDSPGLQGPNFSPRLSGLSEVISKNEVEWVDFTKGKMELECPNGKVHRCFSVCGILKEVDLVINLPKLKTHQLMYYTGAMKNIFGLIPSVAKSPFHVRYPSREAFASMIVDLNLLNKPVYSFMDAVIGMEGAGPAAGSPKQIGLILASSNILAIDVAACIIVGYPPSKIPINREALERQVWLNNFSDIEYPLLQPEESKIQDFVKIHFKKSSNQLLDFLIPKPFRKLRETLNPVPEINHKICVLCGDCMKICASEAISIMGEGDLKQMVLDKQRCIRCYCCHEICPSNAMDI